MQKKQEQLSAEVAGGNHKMNELERRITELQHKMNTNFKAYGSPAHLTTPVVKSDQLKLTFPTFGRSSDDPDPL